jgi:hypothetical protein
MSKKPDSSRKTGWAPSLSAFFYMGPAVALPMGDLLFVPLQSPALGFLATPPQASQQLSDMARVIVTAKLLLDYFGHAL